MCCEHECSCPRPEEGVDCLGWSYRLIVINCPAWVLGTNPGSLQEQAVLVTTEPSLQPHLYRFILGDRALWISSPPMAPPFSSVYCLCLPRRSCIAYGCCTVCHEHLGTLHSVPSAYVNLHSVLFAAFPVHLLHSE